MIYLTMILLRIWLSLIFCIEHELQLLMILCYHSVTGAFHPLFFAQVNVALTIFRDSWLNPICVSKDILLNFLSLILMLDNFFLRQHSNIQNSSSTEFAFYFFLDLTSYDPLLCSLSSYHVDLFLSPTLGQIRLFPNFC